jgi:antibiotic biosynthesis monooxygenase (ABM) superfamily enzyme
VGELPEADRGLQQLTGLETWFKLPRSSVPTMKPPTRWKKIWLISLVAVHSLVLASQALGRPQNDWTAATSTSTAVPAGAADAHDLCGHAGP